MADCLCLEEVATADADHARYERDEHRVRLLGSGAKVTALQQAQPKLG